MLGGLHIGASGLSAAQRAMETAAHNLANVNTEGYTRQRVDLTAARSLDESRGLLGPGSAGQGVVISSLSSAHDELTAANLREQSALSASWDARADFTGRAEGILGPFEGGTSSAMSSFWNSWETLSTDPGNATSRIAVIEAGRHVARSLNDAATRLEGIRGNVRTDMETTVRQVNSLATHVASLNLSIGAAQGAGASAGDLVDQRNLALRQLSELTGAQASVQADGDVLVSIGSMPLVSGVVATAVVTTSSGALQALWPDGRPVAATGRLGSLVETATTAIDDLAAKLDQIATSLRDLVNTAHSAGYGLDGATGRGFFTGSDAQTLSLDAGLTVTSVAASQTGAAGDGNQALVLGGLRTASTTSGVTVNQLINAVQGQLGLRAAEARDQLALSAAVVNELEAQLTSTTGVSADDELTDMLRYQRAFDASARVITVLDQMLDRLINGMGVR